MSRIFEQHMEQPQKAWYVLHTKPRKELQVYNFLRGSGQDVDIYYPSYTIEPANPRSSRIRSYFPNYLFVAAVLEEVGESLLQWLPGAVGLVRVGGEPAVVPENFVHELKRRVAQMDLDGVLRPENLKRGDRVRITSGPFADCDAVFDVWLSGEERVQLLLQWLGRQIRVTAHASAVKRATR